MTNRTLLIEGAHIVTVDAHDTRYDDGYILVRDGEIISIGDSADAPAEADERIDARGQLVIPGLINTHQHPWFTLFKGLAQSVDKNPGEVIGQMSPLSRRPDWVAGARLGYLEMLLSGTTTVLTHWNTPTDIDDVRALLEPGEALGIRNVFAKEVRLVPSLDDQLVLAEESHRAFDRGGRGLTTIGMVLESGLVHRERGTTSDELLTRGHDLAKRLDMPVTGHVGSYTGYQDYVRKYGETDFEYLSRLGVLDEHWVLGHAIVVRDGDIDLIAASGATVSHTPTSESSRGGGIVPVRRMRDRGVRVALGTDGPMVDMTVDMLEQIKAVMLIQNQVHLNPAAITPIEALRMATIDAAVGVGLGDRIGSLEIGKRADIAIFPLETIATSVWLDPLSVATRSLNGRDVQTLIIDGRVVIRQGRLTTASEDEVHAIVEEASARAAHLSSQLI
ncbi:MAG: amidohydrolase family protein [Microbacterium sp.]